MKLSLLFLLISTSAMASYEDCLDLVDDVVHISYEAGKYIAINEGAIQMKSYHESAVQTYGRLHQKFSGDGLIKQEFELAVNEQKQNEKALEHSETMMSAYKLEVGSLKRKLIKNCLTEAPKKSKK